MDSARATQRAAAKALEVSHTTIQNDLGKNLPDVQSNSLKSNGAEKASGTNLPEPWFSASPTEVTRPAQEILQPKCNQFSAVLDCRGVNEQSGLHPWCRGFSASWGSAYEEFPGCRQRLVRVWQVWRLRECLSNRLRWNRQTPKRPFKGATGYSKLGVGFRCV